MGCQRKYALPGKPFKGGFKMTDKELRGQIAKMLVKQVSAGIDFLGKQILLEEINKITTEGIDQLEALIVQREKEAKKQLLNQLYDDLSFHHIFRRIYSSGDYDDGGHIAINKVQEEIIRQLRVLRQDQNKEENNG